MPTIKEETSKNTRDYDIPMNERIVYDIINDSSMYLPTKGKIYEKAFFADKLKELEIGIKVDTEVYANNLLLALKRSASGHNREFDPAKIKEFFDLMLTDFTNCARKLDEISGGTTSAVNYKISNGLIDPLKFVTAMFSKLIVNIDECITKYGVSMKSVDATEDVLNKATYTSVFYESESYWVKLNEEQKKLYDSGKDLFSKESLSLNIKKLRAFKSRVIRIYNKCFGKDSIYAPFNLHDSIITR